MIASCYIVNYGIIGFGSSGAFCVLKERIAFMDYMTVSQASELWGICNRRIVTLCNDGRIEGAIKFGKSWAIPKETKQPSDNRIKSGKYVKKKTE